MSAIKLSLTQYEELVKFMSLTESQDIIDNDTVEHASILVKALVESSKKEIRLFTTSFCPAFYNREEIKAEFESAAKRDVTLRIISRNLIDNNNAFDDYNQFFSKGIKVCIAPDGILDDEQNQLNNFIIIDNVGLRYEQGDLCTPCGETISDVKARASFNRPQAAEFFIAKFDASFMESPVDGADGQ
jgi:sugar-specific transcriptional regulator TrmB